MNTDCTEAGRLALGTAQLGMPYGIANRRGRLSAEEVTAILDRAVRGGIRCFDTAAAYGDAERLIGDYLRVRSLERQVKVVTKLTVGNTCDRVTLRAAVAASRARLGGVPGTVLLHDPGSLAQWEGPVGETLRVCRAEGIVGAIGVSVYHPEQFAAALALDGLEVIQAPASVFDRRLEQAGLLERAYERGVRVMLRSVFLQGLLLLGPGRHPAGLGFAAPRLRRWQELCARRAVDPATVALRFVLQRAGPASVVVGCESESQLRQLLDAAGAPDLPAEVVAELECLATSDRGLLDPTRWPA